MDQERHRRFITIMLLCVVYLLSSYLQSVILDKVENTSSDIMKSAKSYAVSEWRKSTKNSGNNRKPNFKGDFEEGKENDDILEEEFSKIPKIYVELKTCLPRFICEVHSQAPGVSSNSDLEKDVLSLFRNYVFLEGPSSPIYSYQLAAHMGQLAAGLIPSPCHTMYPSCPLSRHQLLELLSGVRTTRRSFF